MKMFTFSFILPDRYLVIPCEIWGSVRGFKNRLSTWNRLKFTENHCET